MLVAGSPFFLSRYRPLTTALQKRIASVTELPVEQSAFSKVAFLVRDSIAGRLRPPFRSCLKTRMQVFAKKPSTFQDLSWRMANCINSIEPKPEFVLQIFSMSSPGVSGLPYAHYIDITMAMAKRAWPAWAPFESDSDFQAWMEMEGTAYRKAERVFTFSQATRCSVIRDYGVPENRVVVVGAAGHFDKVAQHERTYGSRTIIFNGSDFKRKGGDRVLRAFELVQRRFPDASLIIVANSGVKGRQGIHVAGKVTRDRLFSLFEAADVVLAPTRLDVLPGFVMEAMSRGVVPILSDAMSMNEIVTDGLDGYVVSPPTPELLAERICGLFDNRALLPRMGAAARARIQACWNWDAVACSMTAALG
jgi:glycosyltransferase involved in cell wall biosynthesis